MSDSNGLVQRGDRVHGRTDWRAGGASGDQMPATRREDGGVYAAAVCFDLHVPESRSLKTKRAAIRPIVEGLRHKYRLSVAEVDHHDQWQRAAVAVAVVAPSNHQLHDVLENVRRFVDTRPDVELLDSETAYLDGEG